MSGKMQPFQLPKNEAEHNRTLPRIIEGQRARVFSSRQPQGPFAVFFTARKPS